jgi:hypothetical protein
LCAGDDSQDVGLVRLDVVDDSKGTFHDLADLWDSEFRGLTPQQGELSDLLGATGQAVLQRAGRIQVNSLQRRRERPAGGRAPSRSSALSLFEAKLRAQGFHAGGASGLTISQPRFDGLTHVDLMHEVVPGGVVRHFFDKPSSLFLDVGCCHPQIPLRRIHRTVSNGTTACIHAQLVSASVRVPPGCIASPHEPNLINHGPPI